VNDDDTSRDPEPLDVRRALVLGILTSVLAVAFAVLLIGDQVSAAAF
jgi:hypothetical protein